MSKSRGMMTEIGTALAVLAIYLLTILAPMHQARASQLAFEELGYSTIDTGWVLCSSDNTSGQDRDVLVSKCPAAGIGKNDMVEPVLDVVRLDFGASFIAAPLQFLTASFAPSPTTPPSGPRAPPSRV